VSAYIASAFRAEISWFAAAISGDSGARAEMKDPL